jgi:hypothetical protein
MRDIPQDIENLLRSLQPIAPSLTEAELLYQCGWQAAQAEFAANTAAKKPRTSIPFGYGVLSGLAASLLAVVIWKFGQEKSSIDQPQQVVTANRVNSNGDQVEVEVSSSQIPEVDWQALNLWSLKQWFTGPSLHLSNVNQTSVASRATVFDERFAIEQLMRSNDRRRQSLSSDADLSYVSTSNLRQRLLEELD